ncbi:hypothetical protein OF820_06210 [Oceanotoga sp. DSM 15011]|uniref:sigma factor-like helix-turn-helix DNA-binding protein n=1 Tax=Oceanotoga sp. DSM 15011 TaxID=2984951 RepID=UPI0021F4E218|nr:sigma factor-like helix-turn-helix DNA-binding protein [Oceanotoga sp. DSM 15011]UYP01278.1 hypothetical protein OF820_06210 [Oceanotoga sp. DSM 15011]
MNTDDIFSFKAFNKNKKIFKDNDLSNFKNIKKINLVYFLKNNKVSIRSISSIIKEYKNYFILNNFQIDYDFIKYQKVSSFPILNNSDKDLLIYNNIKDKYIFEVEKKYLFLFLPSKYLPENCKDNFNNLNKKNVFGINSLKNYKNLYNYTINNKYKSDDDFFSINFFKDSNIRLKIDLIEDIINYLKDKNINFYDYISINYYYYINYLKDNFDNLYFIFEENTNGSTLKNIGDKLNLSRERIRQIINKNILRSMKFKNFKLLILTLVKNSEPYHKYIIDLNLLKDKLDINIVKTIKYILNIGSYDFKNNVFFTDKFKDLIKKVYIDFNLFFMIKKDLLMIIFI